LQIIGETDQPTIKHPVRSARKRDAVVYDIRPVRFYRPDMSGRGFGAAAAVDQLDPGDRAALVLGT
jgi:hypothetical protein